MYQRREAWTRIQEWIESIAQEQIPPDVRESFSSLVLRLSHRHFHDTWHTRHPRDHRSDVLACMHIVSCFACRRPLRFRDLLDWAGSSDPQSILLIAVQSFLEWMHPALLPEFVELKTLTPPSWVGVSCTLGQTLYTQLVRKRVLHENALPAYDAIVETLVHYLLPPETTTNIAGLVYFQYTQTHIDLYYTYIPVPLYSLFGTPDPLPLIVSLLQGVRCLHIIGIAHRDLKGPNIHTTPNRECMLLDVGAAGYGNNRSTVPVCTITHRSPDILQAEIQGLDHYTYDGKCLDIWSVGVLIAEIYLGPHPFGRVPVPASATRVLAQIFRTKESVLEKLRLICTTTQVEIVRRCLETLPTKRPTIDEVLDTFTKGTD